MKQDPVHGFSLVLVWPVFSRNKSLNKKQNMQHFLSCPMVPFQFHFLSYQTIGLIVLTTLANILKFLDLASHLLSKT